MNPTTIHNNNKTPYSIDEVIGNTSKDQVINTVETLKDRFLSELSFNRIQYKNPSLSNYSFDLLQDKLQDTSDFTDLFVCTNWRKQIVGIAIASHTDTYIATPNSNSSPREQKEVRDLLDKQVTHRHVTHKDDVANCKKRSLSMETWLTNNENTQPNTPERRDVKKQKSAEGIDRTRTNLTNMFI